MALVRRKSILARFARIFLYSRIKKQIQDSFLVNFLPSFNSFRTQNYKSREYFRIIASNEIYIYIYIIWMKREWSRSSEIQRKRNEAYFNGRKRGESRMRERKKERKWKRRGRKQVERQRLKSLLRHSRVINFVPRREERFSPLSRPLFSFPFPR